MPINTVGRRALTAPTTPADVVDSYGTIITSYALQPVPSTEAVLRLSDDARHELLGFQAVLEPRLDPVTGDLAAINDWASKLPGAVVRITGLLHLAEHVGVTPPRTSSWTRPCDAR